MSQCCLFKEANRERVEWDLNCAVSWEFGAGRPNSGYKSNLDLITKAYRTPCVDCPGNCLFMRLTRPSAVPTVGRNRPLAVNFINKTCLAPGWGVYDLLLWKLLCPLTSQQDFPLLSIRPLWCCSSMSNLLRLQTREHPKPVDFRPVVDFVWFCSIYRKSLYHQRVTWLFRPMSRGFWEEAIRSRDRSGKGAVCRETVVLIHSSFIKLPVSSTI